MRAQIKFTGGAELARALKGLGSEVAGRLGSNAVRVGARTMAKAAKDKAPVRTGALRDSIRDFSDPDVNRRGGRERTAWVGSRLFYAYWVEYGTAHTPARSFLRSAFDTNNQETFDKMVQNLGQGIEREAAKYKGR